ncbi:hypothetical protein ABZ508_13665 [Streptomyces lavendulocolor]|uniref:Uncharacterized protein n=1 Tax=Streptomyces lavendulocolor TaxID=67316 RepID=A0ABV2W5I5_9ACTN
MTDTTARSDPRGVAFALLRMTAQDEATHHAAGGDGPPPANMTMYGTLTSALRTWQDSGTLRPNALLLIEWLATEWAGYRRQLLGQDQERFDSWLGKFGDEVSLGQRHAHPAGPTCMELLTVVALDRSGDRPQERAARLAIPFLGYLRAGSELEDAREIALSFALWAGADLSALMQDDADRIAGYTAARTR